MTEVGILIQGRISAWIKDIIQEYKTNFPEAKILLSTWNKENVDGIDCEVVQTEPPKPTHPHNNTTNHQIVGTKYGLSKLDSDIILKCRTDQFVHNKNIFKLYKENCPSEKIMVPDVGSESTDDYRVSDFCQIGTKKILQSFWGNIPLYDGTYAMSPEIYLAKNYS